MAISHNIKPDRGLTYRMLMTGFLLVVLYAAIIGILFIFIKSLHPHPGHRVRLLFCQYWFSAKIAMYAMHAKEVTPEQAPALHGVVDRLCALADMPKPRVAIATDRHPQRLRHRAAAPRPRWSASPRACCGGSTSRRWRPCSRTSSRTSPTATWR